MERKRLKGIGIILSIVLILIHLRVILRTATRVYDFMLNSIKSRLLQKSSREAGQSTQPVTIPQGLASVNTELSEITGRFSRVVGHNMAVFAPFYEDILVEIRNS